MFQFHTFDHRCDPTCWFGTMEEYGSFFDSLQLPRLERRGLWLRCNHSPEWDGCMSRSDVGAIDAARACILHPTFVVGVDFCSYVTPIERWAFRWVLFQPATPPSLVWRSFKILCDSYWTLSFSMSDYFSRLNEIATSLPSRSGHILYQPMSGRGAFTE